MYVVLPTEKTFRFRKLENCLCTDNKAPKNAHTHTHRNTAHEFAFGLKMHRSVIRIFL